MDPRYILDSGECAPFMTSLDDFLSANEGLDAEEIAAIRALKPGETYRSGGGAAAEWSITRTI